MSARLDAAAAPPTQELLLPLRPELPPLPRRLNPRRRSWRMWVREEGVAFGVITAACIAPAYAIAQILLGGAQ